MTTPDLFPRIQKVIAAQLKRDLEEIQLELKMQDDLGADSLDALEIMMSIEEEFEGDFDIQIDESEARNLISVQDIVDYVTKKAVG